MQQMKKWATKKNFKTKKYKNIYHSKNVLEQRGQPEAGPKNLDFSRFDLWTFWRGKKRIDTSWSQVLLYVWDHWCLIWGPLMSQLGSHSKLLRGQKNWRTLTARIHLSSTSSLFILSFSQPQSTSPESFPLANAFLASKQAAVSRAWAAARSACTANSRTAVFKSAIVTVTWEDMKLGELGGGRETDSCGMGTPTKLLYRWY